MVCIYDPILPSTCSPSRSGRTFSSQVETNLGGGRSGPLRPIFGRQDRKSGNNITNVPVLPLPCSISQIPGKTEVDDLAFWQLSLTSFLPSTTVFLGMYLRFWSFSYNRRFTKIQCKIDHFIQNSKLDRR